MATITTTAAVIDTNTDLTKDAIVDNKETKSVEEVSTEIAKKCIFDYMGTIISLDDTSYTEKEYADVLAIGLNDEATHGIEVAPGTLSYSAKMV